ncbi:radical SAM protein [Nitrospirillum sp. BR 11164]|uniref:B12-binding domain-containing radical SAM protein n=1 Tax=Nitrospirillum sp. BR 11164 TaxID=3104324 RepID=UPI002AFF06D9|nr:radical SAM protein [Nitrospirillum sp. BR 11164]MEA1648147.1 radical SAM protein [Nitrospirillum sp. BR 11164]
MTDILLTHGYFLMEDPAERAVMKPYPPLGLLYISAHLKAQGFAVEVMDTTFMDLAAAQAALAGKRPPVVGIYVNLMTRGNALRLAASAKAAGATVVFGGPEPANYAEEYLSRGGDIVVSGEGELTLAELIPHLASHGLTELDQVPGIAYRGEDGHVRRTPARKQIADLDAQPFPDRGAIDLERYLQTWKTHHGVRSVSLIVARGCPYTCNWCSHSVFGHSHRRRSPQNVADEIELIRDTYAPDQLWFADDVFTINQKWLEQFAAEMKRRGLRYPFETITREDRLNERVADLLAELGCYRIWIGAESGSQKILDAMQRRTNAVRMREMISLVQNRGIRAGTFIMLGYDGETWEDIDETARHLRLSAPDDVLTTISYPIKGTPYYDKVADRIAGGGAWQDGSDRALTVVGRKSRRFYRHAQHWLAAESRLGRLEAAPRRDLLRHAKARASSALSRLAMYATRNEVEHG